MPYTYDLPALHKALRKLPKVANVELKDASQAIAKDVASQAKGKASAAGRGWKYLGPTIRATRDRFPVIKVGSTRRIPGRTGDRQAIGDLLYGTEFGGQGGITTMQFLPHLGTVGYVIWPTVRDLTPDIGDRYSRALLDALEAI